MKNEQKTFFISEKIQEYLKCPAVLAAQRRPRSEAAAMVAKLKNG